MKRRLFSILLLFCLLLSLTACTAEKQEETVPVVTEAPAETAEAVPETTEVPPETAVSGLLEDNVDGVVCVGFVPTTAGS